MQVFYKTAQQARALATAVHTSGKGIAGVYSKEVAEMKLIQAMDLAKVFEHPLLLTMEEE
jgi:ATP-dependent Clp protease adaptor protein ClpS